MAKKTKAHQRYRLKDGTIVPSTTTIINELGWNKNALVAWARRVALAGNDPDKVRDQAADIGTLAHYMIECHLKGEEPDISEYGQADIDKAENCYLNYLEWEKEHVDEVWHSELQLVSEVHKYGGTMDLVGVIDGKPSLLDFKSSKGIYPEFKIQIAAYLQLYFENFRRDNSPALLTGHILRLDKSGDGFEHHVLGRLTDADAMQHPWEVFVHCRQLYDLKKKVC
jgi:hypothetical protein